ncbi:hypothetical protein HYU07_06845 [Candidatus Woesearchaeota archaeon]|nr:hypothetical protein [Candidatus Woesearchaeota archaeon]
MINLGEIFLEVLFDKIDKTGKYELLEQKEVKSIWDLESQVIENPEYKPFEFKRTASEVCSQGSCMPLEEAIKQLKIYYNQPLLLERAHNLAKFDTYTRTGPNINEKQKFRLNTPILWGIFKYKGGVETLKHYISAMLHKVDLKQEDKIMHGIYFSELNLKPEIIKKE